MRILASTGQATRPQQIRPAGTTRPRPVLRATPADVKLPPDFSDIPLPSGFTASGPVHIVEGTKYTTKATGVEPRYKEQS